ncbi:MAG: tetratricopeptide repeat protein [Planctomycetia bacterium]|nr:tetratricopeptide repeat protein [Planctomycetia bacterium]
MSIRTTHPLIVGLLLAQLAAVSGCQATKSMFSGGNQDIARTNPQTQQPQLLPGVPPSEPTAALTKNQKMNVQMALARSLERQHKQQDAMGIYQEIARRDKTNAEAWHRMAVISDMDGKPDKATEYYKLALENAPKNADIYCDRGYSQYLQRRWAESEQSYRKAIELKPDLTRAYNNLGMLLARTGRQNDALMAFHHAGNDESEARCNMALAMMLEKHWDEAENECRTALQNKHTSPKTREKLDHFSNLIAQARPGGNKTNMSASTGLSANTGMSSPSINRPVMAAQPENVAYRAPAAAQSVPMQSMPAPAIAPAIVPAPANYQTAANVPAQYNPPAIAHTGAGAASVVRAARHAASRWKHDCRGQYAGRGSVC